ncbi:MAG: carboxypeptidase-like regulatory domain-containing protein [Planctomycetaceae bacterium]|jgi:5-hydroxyisourate hydrolase-like protein (transthyretin family)|nr:carboxypeptidase-like regulatory domain-containing protein [Planctomycetaceae bacterium]
MKTLKTKFAFTLFFVLLLGFASCNKMPKPDGMPDLHSVKITIMQEGTPLEDAAVTLLNNDSSQSKWVVGGRTDASGVCTLKTQGKYNGAPAGKYKIIVSKTEKIESETAKQPVPQDSKAAEAYYAKISSEEKFYDYVDLKYKSPNTSGLEIEITAGKNEQTFDVGKSIKKEFVPFGK